MQNQKSLHVNILQTMVTRCKFRDLSSWDPTLLPGEVPAACPYWWSPRYLAVVVPWLPTCAQHVVLFDKGIDHGGVHLRLWGEDFGLSNQGLQRCISEILMSHRSHLMSNLCHLISLFQMWKCGFKKIGESIHVDTKFILYQFYSRHQRILQLNLKSIRIPCRQLTWQLPPGLVFLSTWQNQGLEWFSKHQLKSHLNKSKVSRCFK